MTGFVFSSYCVCVTDSLTGLGASILGGGEGGGTTHKMSLIWCMSCCCSWCVVCM